LPYYLAMIESLDTEMGRLVSTEKLRLLQRNVLIFHFS